MHQAAAGGIDPIRSTQPLQEYGDANMTLARGLEAKTTDPYLAGWRHRVVPTLGHLPLQMISYGAVDRAVHGWIADGCGRSTGKNSPAVLVRIMEQAVRDGIVDRNPVRITGWQREYQRAEDELDDPRTLALPNWQALQDLADALVVRSPGQFRGWGEIVTFCAVTAARIGEVSGCRRTRFPYHDTPLPPPGPAVSHRCRHPAVTTPRWVPGGSQAAGAVDHAEPGRAVVPRSSSDRFRR